MLPLGNSHPELGYHNQTQVLSELHLDPCLYSPVAQPLGKVRLNPELPELIPTYTLQISDSTFQKYIKIVGTFIINL